MGLKVLDPASLERRLQGGSVSILDVNDRASWRAARVPGARNLDPERFGEADLGADRDRPLVFYCSNPLCRKAPMAARRAERLGYRDVSVLPAGIRGWIAAGLPTEAGE
jgi:rhodanese-related sulfurtransferase